MPFIHIKSLPFDESLDVSAVLENLNKDFAEETGIDVQHVSSTWEFFPSGHYAVGEKSANHHTQDSHPVLIDLLVPDFNSAEHIETMLSSIASSLAKHSNIRRDNIFINARTAQSGMVFDRGEVVRW